MSRIARLSVKVQYPPGRRPYATHIPQPPIVFSLRPPSPPSLPSPTSSKTSLPSSSPSSQKQTSSPSSSFLPKPRLDYSRLLSDPSLTEQNALSRRAPLRPDHLAHLSRLRDTQLLLLQKLDSVRNKQKDISSMIKNQLGDTSELVRQAKKLKARIQEYTLNLSSTEDELLELALLLPSFSHPDSPIGSEENARVIEQFGPTPMERDEKRDHLYICEKLGWLDNKAMTTTTGSSWPFLIGQLSLLEQSLIQYSISIAVKHGFTPVSTPDVVKDDLAWRCGFQPRDQAGVHLQTQPDAVTEASEGRRGKVENNDKEVIGQPDQIYRLQTPPTSPGLCLAGTAEIPLAGLFADRILQLDQLPRKVVGVGKAYRAEAGARGTDTRGLYRVHWFTKVELFAVTKGAVEESERMMEEMKEVQKEVAKGLGLSVRILDMPTEELGASACRKYDMEAWMPGRGKWGEITSTSNCTDYQARRLHIRHRHFPPPSPPLPPSPSSSSSSSSTQTNITSSKSSTNSNTTSSLSHPSTPSFESNLNPSSTPDLTPNLIHDSSSIPPLNSNTNSNTNSTSNADQSTSRQPTSLPFAHTLNGTAAAIPRLLVAIIENGAKFGSDGELKSVELPFVLKRFWIGTDENISWASETY
ncbi:serine-tRNA ligase [Tremella mesenterica]|uniref:serine--tRNA ligase n=1 Tax=Tremella mesenterica TaxID=5217 RepID=A0A4Q1BQ15_TREME|nr:serine-tRNA ligase [Tremella mesenterica]